MSKKTEPTRRMSGCMVCGKPLIYPETEIKTVCSYCGETFGTNATCVDGHFVCDACHVADALGVIEKACLTTDETDMIALLGRIRSHAAIPLHGPEHHAMVPGIILATYRNLGGSVTDTQIRTAIRRGSTVAGGSCGFMGVCGAAVGVGVAFGILLDANPLDPAGRHSVQTVVRRVIESISSLEAARCCQREAVLALRKAAEISPQYLPVTLQADTPIACVQIARNAECLGRECPLWPTPRGKPLQLGRGRPIVPWRQ